MDRKHPEGTVEITGLFLEEEGDDAFGDDGAPFGEGGAPVDTGGSDEVGGFCSSVDFGDEG